MGEFETEPIRGLPEMLPEGEEILWQGSPSWQGLARRALHVRKVAAYFGLLGAWRIATALSTGEPFLQALVSLAGLALLAFAAVAVLSVIAWLQARATVYTITNRRVVLRFGVAFTLALNLPFRAIQSAALRAYPDSSGDIVLSVSGAGSVGYMLLWPHARPWRFGSRAEPMLRCVPEASSVAARLARALAVSEGQGAAPSEETAPVRARRPSVATAAV
jgi:hypothetical protein